MRSYDNAVSKNLFKLVVNKVCKFEIPFFFAEQTAYQPDGKTIIKEPCHSSWAHVCYDANPQAKHVSPINDLIYSAVLAGFDNCNEEVQQIYRIRIGLITAQSTNLIHMPHVDFPFPHKNCLFYLNDSDGDTLIYEEKFNNRQPLDTFQYYVKNYQSKEMNILHRSTPKANKMVFFDGAHYHSSSTPTNNPARIVININYI